MKNLSRAYWDIEDLCKRSNTAQGVQQSPLSTYLRGIALNILHLELDFHVIAFAFCGVARQLIALPTSAQSGVRRRGSFR